LIFVDRSWATFINSRFKIDSTLEFSGNFKYAKNEFALYLLVSSRVKFFASATEVTVLKFVAMSLAVLSLGLLFGVGEGLDPVMGRGI
jgi:hypothetical protein